MKEILKQLFGDAVTEDAMKQFNAELGKKFVAKVDYNAKLEAIKSLEGDKKSLEDKIGELTESANTAEEYKSQLEKLKSDIAEKEKEAKAEAERMEKEASITNRFTSVLGDKKFSHEAIKADYLKKFSEALENKAFEGKSDADIFHELTKDDANAFEGVSVFKLSGGNPSGGLPDERTATLERAMGLNN